MDDLMHMQRQAARRVQRMQEHSRQVLEQYREQEPAAGARHWPGDTPVRLASPGLYIRPSDAMDVEPTDKPVLPDKTTEASVDTLTDLDTEQWFLLGLALLLFRSGCRPELALSLLYLAM